MYTIMFSFLWIQYTQGSNTVSIFFLRNCYSDGCFLLWFCVSLLWYRGLSYVSSVKVKYKSISCLYTSFFNYCIFLSNTVLGFTRFWPGFFVYKPCYAKSLLSYCSIFHVPCSSNMLRMSSPVTYGRWVGVQCGVSVGVVLFRLVNDAEALQPDGPGQIINTISAWQLVFKLAWNV
jgi:hypothetical protein